MMWTYMLWKWCQCYTQEILGFSTTQIHYVFCEMGQSSVIVTFYGLNEKIWVGCDIFGGNPFSESKC
jgi:hypothetical protein